MRLRLSFLLLLPLLSPLSLTSQTAPQTAAPAQTPDTALYSLQLKSQLVIEDVTVLDRNGKAVTGLAPSAFHVFDDKKAQPLTDVRELDAKRGTTSPAVAADKAGSFSNASLLRNQGNVVVLLIDPSTMQLEDQMRLRQQALKFIDNASGETSMAVFRVNSSGIPVLLQPLTRVKAQLKTAISAAVPILTRPSYSAYNNAVAELTNISAYLRPVPGRKAVLWMAGAFPLYQAPEFGALCTSGNSASCGTNSRNVDQDAYRALAEARVAVYPVDVRGVQMGGMTAVPVVGNGLNGAPPSPGAKPTSESEKVAGEYDTMDSLAQATGGKAFYSDNNVAALLTEAVSLTSAGYTLTYHPQDEKDDGRWHTVSIRVDGPYTLAYRTGYFAPSSAAPDASRGRLTADDRRADPAAPDAPSSRTDQAAQPGTADAAQPLVFRAQVVAEPRASSPNPRAKTHEVRIRYVIPTDQLAFDGQASGHARFRLAALAYDAEGDVLNQAMDVIETHYSAEQRKLAGNIGTPADQTIEVGKQARYLLLAVEDLSTEKVGVVQLPLAQVPEDNADAAKTH